MYICETVRRSIFILYNNTDARKLRGLRGFRLADAAAALNLVFVVR